MPRSVEEVCAIVRAKATSEERATLLRAAARLTDNDRVALDPAFANEDDVIKFLRGEPAGAASGSGQAGAGAGAEIGLDPIMLERRLHCLELSMPARLSRTEVLNAYGALFVIMEDTEGRPTKLSRQSVNALAASSSGGNAGPLYGGSGFFYKRKDLAVTALHQISDAERSGKPLVVKLPHTNKTKHLQFWSGDESLDVAYLRCVDSDDDQPFLEPDETFDKIEAVAAQLVMITPLINFSSQFEEEPQLGQRLATVTGVFTKTKRFCYSASTFAGDRGCPILVRNGKVVGMHVEMINAYQPESSSERSSKASKSRVERMEASIASSGPHGGVGIFTSDFPPVRCLLGRK